MWIAMYAMHGKWNEQEPNPDRGWITKNRTLRIEWVFDWILKDLFVLAVQPLRGWWFATINFHALHTWLFTFNSFGIKKNNITN